MSTAPRVPTTTQRRSAKSRSVAGPLRFGALAQAISQGDSPNAACAAAMVPRATFHDWVRRGEDTIHRVRPYMHEDIEGDVEGRIWGWIQDGGGFGTAGPDEWFWTARVPRWWPADEREKWKWALFTMVIYWARGRAEQVYRASVTRAAQGDLKNGILPDWKAAQFMLTHSFGWRSAERIEVTGADGGPVEMQVSQDQVLATLAALSQRRTILDQ